MISKMYFIILKYSMCVCVVERVQMCAGTQGGQRHQILLELKLKVVVRHHVDAKN